MKATVSEDYARGSVPFLGVTVLLASHPLVPRTETEYWTERAIAKMRTRSGTLRILDLCAGSGCIGLAVLAHVADAHVTFGELIPKHLDTLKTSLALNRIDAARATLVESDLFQSISGTFDFILTNPPYLSRQHIERVADDVLALEPHEALFADDDGFALIERIIQTAPQYLAPLGELWIEHEPEHVDAIKAAASNSGLSAQTFADQYGTLRYSVILRI